MIAGCFNQQFDTTDIAVADEELNVEDPPHELSWNYPLKPGMLEWNQLKTEKERIAALQVPEDVLAKLTPDELVGQCITFPLFGDFKAFNTPQIGFYVMLNRFNIFGHFLYRSDTGKV